MDTIKKAHFPAGNFRWFPKAKEDFVSVKRTKFDKVFNKNLWKKNAKPEIDESNPSACMNLSLEDLPSELWKPIHGIEDQFQISNKGRIKRLNGWIKSKRFLKERIMSLF